MSLKALKEITEIKNTENSLPDENEEAIPKIKWLVFYIGDKKYAIKESEVQNILKSVTLYFYPFAPFYVEGVINFNNKIYSVVNYHKMIMEASVKSDSVLYIVVKNSTEDFSIMVSKIDDFFMIPEENYSENIDAFFDKTQFIKGFIQVDEERVPVLDTSRINEAVISDCKKEKQ